MSKSVTIELSDAVVQGDLTMPPGAQALVVFVHGSGGGRHNPRNGFVAEKLNESGLVTIADGSAKPSW